MLPHWNCMCLWDRSAQPVSYAATLTLHVSMGRVCTANFICCHTETACVYGTGLHSQFHMLPHWNCMCLWDRSAQPISYAATLKLHVFMGRVYRANFICCHTETACVCGTGLHSQFHNYAATLKLHVSVGRVCTANFICCHTETACVYGTGLHSQFHMLPHWNCMCLWDGSAQPISYAATLKLHVSMGRVCTANFICCHTDTACVYGTGLHSQFHMLPHWNCMCLWDRSAQPISYAATLKLHVSMGRVYRANFICCHTETACVYGTGLHSQFHMLPHWNCSSRSSNLLSYLVTVVYTDMNQPAPTQTVLE